MTTLRCVAAVAREPIYEAKYGLVTVCCVSAIACIVSNRLCQTALDGA